MSQIHKLSNSLLMLLNVVLWLILLLLWPYRESQLISETRLKSLIHSVIVDHSQVQLQPMGPNLKQYHWNSWHAMRDLTGDVNMPFCLSICEGKKDVNAQVTALELAAIACSMINPRVQAFCSDFPWKYDEFTVCDTSWVDLDQYPNPKHTYFYNECIQVNMCKKQKGGHVPT
ncbi:hypothetical protein V8B97DRAFT_1918368 [Scleroderma yunnanense]